MLRQMADRLQGCINADQAWDVAVSVLPDLDIDAAIFVDATNPNAARVRSTADDHWTRAYQSSVQCGRDPFARVCLSRVEGVLTGVGHLAAHDYLTLPEQEEIATGSAALGISTGVSITSIPGIGGAGAGWNLMTRLSAREFSELYADREAEWRAWSQLAFASLWFMSGGRKPSALSVRERDCLAHVADGLRVAEIAARLGIAEVTVEMHLRNARIRLDAKTRDQAVAKAVMNRMI